MKGLSIVLFIAARSLTFDLRRTMRAVESERFIYLLFLLFFFLKGNVGDSDRMNSSDVAVSWPMAVS